MAAAIADLLPEVFRRAAGDGSLLGALLEVVEELLAPDLAVLASIDAVYDPHRTPDAFVPLLASWVDLDRFLPTPPPDGSPPAFAAGTGQLRELVARAAELSRARGTRAGLVALLETATGVPGFRVDEQPGAFHLRVVVPAGAAHLGDLVAQLVEDQKPAYATAELQLAPRTDGATP